MFRKLASTTSSNLFPGLVRGADLVEKIVARQKPLGGSRVAARQIASYIRGESALHVRRAPQIRPQGVNCATGRRAVYTHGPPRSPLLSPSRTVFVPLRSTTVQENNYRTQSAAVRSPRGVISHNPPSTRRPRPSSVRPKRSAAFWPLPLLVVDPKYLTEIHDKHDSHA